MEIDLNEVLDVVYNDNNVNFLFHDSVTIFLNGHLVVQWTRPSYEPSWNVVWTGTQTFAATSNTAYTKISATLPASLHVPTRVSGIGKRSQTAFSEVELTKEKSPVIPTTAAGDPVVTDNNVVQYMYFPVKKNTITARVKGKTVLSVTSGIVLQKIEQYY